MKRITWLPKETCVPPGLAARLGLLAWVALGASVCLAAAPGLPFTEDFGSDALQDAAQTNANWSTDAQALVLAWRQQQFGSFVDAVGIDIGTEVHNIRALAVGDVDGDGDLDLIAGNFLGETNRLYLNNGTADPFNGVDGIEIGSDTGSTFALALGDVDGDGDLDLIFGNGGGQINRLYLNNGTADPWAGVIGSDIGAATGNTNALVLADVDGDGNLDLITGNIGQRNRLYLNNGTADPWAGVAGSDISTEIQFTFALALGDVDGDGDLDLIVGNYNSQPNRLYLNNGTADPFNGVVGSDISTDAHNTRALALGDVDGDGDLDLIAGNDAGETNRLYLNNGTANPFNGVIGSDLSADTRATYALALGDIDGDGDLDLIAANYNQTNRLYRNNGTAAPWAGVTGSDISADSQQTVPLALADVDGDGDLDLITGNLNQTLRLYLNHGSANPWHGVVGGDLSSDGQLTEALAVGDVDGDGDLDLIAGNRNQPNRLYLNNGSADPFNGVTGSDISTDAHNTWTLALADVDGDGDLDLIAGNNNESNRLYLNNGSADPWNGVAGIDLGSGPENTVALAVADIDGDGDLDLVTGNNSQPNRLYLNNGSANPFNGVTGIDISADSHPTRTLAVADIDGDGDLDLIAGNVGTNRLYLNNGSADPFNGVAGIDIGTDAHNTRAVALGDVDGDGDLDLIAGNANSETNRLYLNNGSADPFNGVSGTDISADGHDTWTLALADVDGDGDLDLIAGNVNQPNRLYLNNGSADPWAGVAGRDISADADSTRALALADADGDGDLDLIAGNDLNQTNRLYLNQGGGIPWAGFLGNDISTDNHATRTLALGDVNGDGKLDLIAGNANNQINRLYLNNGADVLQGGFVATDIGSSAIPEDVRQTPALALGDVDGDGDLDLIAGNIGVANRLYLNNGTANPFDGVIGIDLAYNHPNRDSYALALGDVDGDGDLDLIVGNYNGQNNLLYLNNGTADPFDGVSGTNISTDLDWTTSLALGDVDGDGDLDLIAGNAIGQTNRLYLNNGTADPFNGVVGSNISTDGHDTWALALADVNGNGHLDLVVGNGGTASAINRLYLNNGTADPFNGVVGSDITGDVHNTWDLVLADVNRDGKLDLVVGNRHQANRLYLNNGTADPFNGVVGSNISADTDNTRALVVGDIDGDGVLDLIAGNFNQTNRLYFPWLFHTVQGRAASLRVDTATEPTIASVTLSAIDFQFPHTGIDYWLSNNGGTRWFLTRSGQPFVFPTEGADLRWKAELHSLSPTSTPLVDVIDITRNALAQSISFGANPGPLVFGGVSGAVSAAASSGLPVSFGSDTPPICTVDPSSGTLTLLAAGDCIIRADQAGDGNYLPAPPVTQTVVIEPAAQAISFGPNPGPLVFGGASGTVSATASSGLPVSFASATLAVCEVDAVSGELSLFSVGDCVVTADQPGDVNHQPAPQATQTVRIVASLVFKDGFE